MHRISRKRCKAVRNRKGWHWLPKSESNKAMVSDIRRISVWRWVSIQKLVLEDNCGWGSGWLGGGRGRGYLMKQTGVGSGNPQVSSRSLREGWVRMLFSNMVKPLIIIYRNQFGLFAKWSLSLHTVYIISAPAFFKTAHKENFSTQYESRNTSEDLNVCSPSTCCRHILVYVASLICTGQCPIICLFVLNSQSW